MNGIWSALGRKSVTLCLVGKRIDLKISYREYWNQFRIKAYTSSDALESVNFPRLKYTPYHRWFDEGAICRVVFKADIPVAFSWTHYKEHSIGNVGIFDMGDSIAWLGPYFVHKNYRGLSLQQLMIECLGKYNKFYNFCESKEYCISSFFFEVELFYRGMFSLFSWEDNY